MNDTTIMRLTRSHRKANVLDREIPRSEYLFESAGSWFYWVPNEDVIKAKRLGLTVSRYQP